MAKDILDEPNVEKKSFFPWKPLPFFNFSVFSYAILAILLTPVLLRSQDGPILVKILFVFFLLLGVAFNVVGIISGISNLRVKRDFLTVLGLALNTLLFIVFCFAVTSLSNSVREIFLALFR